MGSIIETHFEQSNINVICNEILSSLKGFKDKHGLYIIIPRNKEVLEKICKKLNYEYRSNIAYIGKGAKTKSSNLFVRSKQEMGWSNFEGATFVRKIGRYLDCDIHDKIDKEQRERTRSFICSNFTIECWVFPYDTDLLKKETEFINKFHPCLNDKKTNNLKGFTIL